MASDQVAHLAAPGETHLHGEVVGLLAAVMFERVAAPVDADPGPFLELRHHVRRSFSSASRLGRKRVTTVMSVTSWAGGIVLSEGPGLARGNGPALRPVSKAHRA